MTDLTKLADALKDVRHIADYGRPGTRDVDQAALRAAIDGAEAILRSADGVDVAANLVEMVDAAMVEMKNIHPPLRRSECERLIRAALESALRLALAAREWQPIETAPKDGRSMLLGYPNGAGKWRTVRGQWFSDAEIAETWEEDGDEGWYETSVECEDLPNCWAIEPTHWMPLPAAAPKGTT